MIDRLIGKCVEVGNDGDGQARIVIHTTREQLREFKGNLVYADVMVMLQSPMPLMTVGGAVHPVEVDKALETEKLYEH
jgi:hypothetical protein